MYFKWGGHARVRSLFPRDWQVHELGGIFPGRICGAHVRLDMSPKQMVFLTFFLVPPRRCVQRMTREIHGRVVNHGRDDEECQEAS